MTPIFHTLFKKTAKKWDNLGTFSKKVLFLDYNKTKMEEKVWQFGHFMTIQNSQKSIKSKNKCAFSFRLSELLYMIAARDYIFHIIFSSWNSWPLFKKKHFQRSLSLILAGDIKRNFIGFMMIYKLWKSRPMAAILYISTDLKNGVKTIT